VAYPTGGATDGRRSAVGNGQGGSTVSRLVGLDHVQLAMPAGPEAEQAAVDFYSGALGLSWIPKPAALVASGGCWFEVPGVRLHLGVDADFRPARKAHPGLVVDDLDGLIAALAALGHPFTPDDRLPGVRRGYVDDPFGNRLELVARAPEDAVKSDEVSRL
jgi:catechol 2,3-dioxygenase-like lactoylglutathione lyase family enzyme